MKRVPKLNFLLTFLLLAIARIGASQSNLATALPAEPRKIDLLAMQMQDAVLRARDIRKVEQLLQQGADINAPIGCGTFSIVDGAVQTRNLELLKFALAHGAKPRGHELADAAFTSNAHPALEICQVLLAAGVDPNATNNYGSTPLACAAYFDNRNLVNLFLAQPHVNLNTRDVDGSTALIEAVRHNSFELVTLLLRAGANANIREHNRHLHFTALNEAAYHNHPDMVALLLAQPGIEVDVPDPAGDTARMFAVRHDSPEIVKLLLRAGANPKLADNQGLSPYDCTRSRAVWDAIDSAIESKKNYAERPSTTASASSPFKQ